MWSHYIVLYLRSVALTRSFLKHLGRYLRRLPFLVHVFKWKNDISEVRVQSDSDWAGDIESNKNISDDDIMWDGNHLEGEIPTQKVKGMSSAEIESYAIESGAHHGMTLGHETDELEAAAAHEVGHALGFMRVRRADGKARNQRSCQRATACTRSGLPAPDRQRPLSV